VTSKLSDGSGSDLSDTHLLDHAFCPTNPDGMGVVPMSRSIVEAPRRGICASGMAALGFPIARAVSQKFFAATIKQPRQSRANRQIAGPHIIGNPTRARGLARRVGKHPRTPVRP
jgi:hypothetical protein